MKGLRCWETRRRLGGYGLRLRKAFEAPFHDRKISILGITAEVDHIAGRMWLNAGLMPGR